MIVRHPEIAPALMAKYREGVVYGGTSAGTAIMSDPMLWAPDKQPELFTTMKGLGLLPTDIMVDQHFFARESRLARLKASLLKHHLPYGLGVDEDGAVTVTDGRFVTVHGQERVMVLLNFEDSTPDKITEFILKPGDRYELISRK